MEKIDQRQAAHALAVLRGELEASGNFATTRGGRLASHLPSWNGFVFERTPERSRGREWSPETHDLE